MSKIKVLVVDDGSSEGFFDLDPTVLRDGVEIIGSLRINPRAESLDLLTPWQPIKTAAVERTLVHESAPAPVADPRPGVGGRFVPGLAAPDASDASVYLTRTELDVLRLLASGQRNKDIARELYVSVNTVKSHVASIFRKLRVKNRSQAVRYVYSCSAR